MPGLSTYLRGTTLAVRRSVGAAGGARGDAKKSDRVSLGGIADLLGTRSIGVWLLILALPMALPVPAPAISVLFGVPLMIISIELMLGYRRA